MYPEVPTSVGNCRVWNAEASVWPTIRRLDAVPPEDSIGRIGRSRAVIRFGFLAVRTEPLGARGSWRHNHERMRTNWKERLLSTGCPQLYLANGRKANPMMTEVLTSIQTLGYAHLTGPLTAEDFEMIAQQLGSVGLRTDLALTPERSSIVYKPDEITLHQDNPEINLLGWYCVRQDEFDGSAHLLDTADIAQHFSPHDIATLSSVNVRYPDPDQSRHNPDKGLISHLLWPLVTEKTGHTAVYYVPWLLLDSYDQVQHRVLEKFTEYLRAKEVNQLIRIRLAAGEMLFIDNQRMLHGRGPIRPDSKRFLKRVWITY